MLFGRGIWRPERESLAGIRKAIAENPKAWTQLWKRKGLASWSLGGDSLKRAPRGFDADHPLIDEIKRTDFIGILDISTDEVLDPDFLRNVATRFRGTQPFVKFLTRAVGLEF